LIGIAPPPYTQRVLEPYEDYRSFLKDEFHRRSGANASYSLRAFARDLKMPPSRLSEVFSGKTGLSTATAAKVAAQLGFGDKDREFFVALVESKHGRSSMQKTRARKQLEQARRDAGFKRIDEKTFRTVADWSAQAILELVETEGFEPDAAWIARRLSLPVERIERVLTALFGTRQLIRNTSGGREQWKAAEASTTVGDALPSFAIRSFHKGVMHKAFDALDRQPMEQRDFSTLVLALDESKLPEAKLLIRKFRREFGALMKSPIRNRVYALCVQLFGLDGGDPLDSPDGGHA